MSKKLHATVTPKLTKYKLLKLHDDAHLVTMRMRLDRDIRRAIRRGFTNKDEFYVVENMHNSYKALGGNGC